jgi:hypothetical protein
MTEAAISGWRRVTGGLRSLVRELAAAVYVVLGSSFLSRLLYERNWSTLAVDPALTFAAGFILGAAVKGGWWTTHLVGVFVSVLQIGITLALRSSGEALPIASLLIGAAVVSISGAFGAQSARWASRRRSAP